MIGPFSSQRRAFFMHCGEGIFPQPRTHTFLTIIKKISTKYMGYALYLIAKNTVFYGVGLEG